MIQDSVEAHIFHQPDSAALGFVDYLPLWTPVGISPVNSEIPSKYMLYDAYPNPFNPVTNIRFEIPLSGNVKISVYDIEGKEVTILLNEFISPGKYEVQFDGGNFSSGVYFFSIVSGNFLSTKKLVLVK